MIRPTNSALAQLAPSGIRRINVLAAEQGDCIPLALGEPDFATPEPICAEAAAALARGETHYPPNNGTPALRQAIAGYMSDQGLVYDAADIIVTVGATEALSSTFRALLDPGDEVIIPVPAFTVYESDVLMCHGRVVQLDTAPTAFQIRKDSLAACVTPARRVRCSAGATSGVSVWKAGVCRELPMARTKSATMTTHTGSTPVSETIATTTLTAAMKRSAPMSVTLSGRRSTMAPAKVPKSASGRKPASDASESMLAEFVVSVMCQTRPICRMELVSTETSSPPHTDASLSFQASLPSVI